MQKLILASSNKGKLAEFQALFDANSLNLTVIPQDELGVLEVAEDGLSFIENAIIKARHASAVSGLPAIADDSGLCVPVLGNFPGIYSARYAGQHGNDLANNTKLINELQPFFERNEVVQGFFVCVLALVRHKSDPLPIITQGLWQGEILSAPKGDNGFGYDPLFWLPDLGKTSAQLTKNEKNQISHRGQALQKLVAQLNGVFDE